MRSAVRPIRGTWNAPRRFAGFYLNEDPAAPNYDPRLKIIRSLFNGSKGPVTRPVTPVDWDGDEDPKRAERFSTSSNIRGDHPLNLLATTLATQAYLLTHEAKDKRWVLEYVDAWRDRAAANGGNFPSNIGLDGTYRRRMGRQAVRRNFRVEQPGRWAAQLRAARHTWAPSARPPC